jgi:hypothetical protein
MGIGILCGQFPGDLQDSPVYLDAKEVFGLSGDFQCRLECDDAVDIRDCAFSDIGVAVPLRQKYNENKAEIDRLKPELAAWQQKQEEIAQAKEEAKSDNDVQTDDYYRIPAIMQDCKTAYNITWQDNGWL